MDFFVHVGIYQNLLTQDNVGAIEQQGQTEEEADIVDDAKRRHDDAYRWNQRNVPSLDFVVSQQVADTVDHRDGKQGDSGVERPAEEHHTLTIAHAHLVFQPFEEGLDETGLLDIMV